MISENKVVIMKFYKSISENDIPVKELEIYNNIKDIEVREMGGKTIQLKSLFNENRFQYIEI